MAEIHLRQLAHSYSDNPQGHKDYAIREMDHVWEKGGAYALLGPSGCGKSTLLNIISGLVTPSEGQILFDGHEVNSLTPQQRNIAQVFQFPVIYDTMSVYDNLAFPLRNVGKSEAEISAKVKDIAYMLELEDVLKKKAKNLTADEKQKVSMGRGLVRDDVSAILFDEPLTVIDPHLKWKLRRKLKQIHEQFNITMVYVTHDQLEASTFADKIAVMYGGQVVQFGTPRELFEKPEHTFVGYFIGSPGMNFFEGSFLQNELYLEGHQVALSKEMKSKLAITPYNSLKLGIRPEFVEVLEANSPLLNKLSTDENEAKESLLETCENCFKCEVVLVSDLGTYKIVSLKLGNTEFKARLPEEQAVPSGSVYVRFPSNWLKVYADEYLVD